MKDRGDASGEGYATRLGVHQFLALRRGWSPVLSRLDIELTERCNNDCIHCYINLPAGDRLARERELSAAQVRAILEEAASLGCLAVRFTGGEPLLRDDFEELYLAARRLGMAVQLFTNGTLITPHLAELLARVPPREKVEISLYGLAQASYEAVTRTPGSFVAARRGLRLLLDAQVPVLVKGALLPANREELDRFESWAAALPGMDGPPRMSVFLDLRGRRDSAAKNRAIEGLRPSPEEGARIASRRAGYVKGMRERCARFLGPPGERLFSCGAGMGSACLDAYGRLQPCLLLRHPDTVYDLARGSLEEAMTSFFPALRTAKAGNADYLARCARCFLKGLCEQCPAKSWMEHGTLDTPVEYLCEVAHAQARTLGLLQGSERSWQVEDWRERIARFAWQGTARRDVRQDEARGCDP